MLVRNIRLSQRHVSIGHFQVVVPQYLHQRKHVSSGFQIGDSHRMQHAVRRQSRPVDSSGSTEAAHKLAEPESRQRIARSVASSETNSGA